MSSLTSIGSACGHQFQLRVDFLGFFWGFFFPPFFNLKCFSVFLSRLHMSLKEVLAQCFNVWNTPEIHCETSHNDGAFPCVTEQTILSQYQFGYWQRTRTSTNEQINAFASNLEDKDCEGFAFHASGTCSHPAENTLASRCVYSTILKLILNTTTISEIRILIMFLHIHIKSLKTKIYIYILLHKDAS